MPPSMTLRPPAELADSRSLTVPSSGRKAPSEGTVGLTTKPSGPGYGPAIYTRREGAARGRGPLLGRAGPYPVDAGRQQFEPGGPDSEPDEVGGLAGLHGGLGSAQEPGGVEGRGGDG